MREFQPIKFPDGSFGVLENGQQLPLVTTDAALALGISYCLEFCQDLTKEQLIAGPARFAASQMGKAKSERKTAAARANGAKNYKWTRDNQATHLLLTLVELTRMPSLEEIADWDDETVKEVEKWASAIQLQASDNKYVRIPTMPWVLNV